MPSAPFRLNRSGLLLAVVSAAFASQVGAAAGRAEFIVGGVTIAGRDGVQRPLARGSELDNGDTVRTNDGRAQIRFTDGAYVSLQPNSEYSIRDYRFDNRADGTERGFFGLLKGAMRTVTGAIGRINRDRYQVQTPTATVGIRGTGGVIQVQDDGSTLVIGTSGIWSLTNPAGSVDVPAGTSALAPTDPGQPPQETTQAPTSGPAPVQQKQPEFVAGEQRDEQGQIVVPPPLAPEPTYFAFLFFSEGGTSGVASADFLFGAPQFDGLGRLTQISGNGTVYTLDPVSGVHADFGTDGILTWGRWTGLVTGSIDTGDGIFPFQEPYTSNQGFHYVVGIPTSIMPTTGTATYTLIGASRPTYVADIGVSPGTFTGSLSVDFSALTVGMNLNVAMPNQNYGITGNAPINGPTFAGDTFQRSLSCSGGSGCDAFVAGFFSGSNAERAGLGYHIMPLFDTDIVGTAAFRR